MHENQSRKNSIILKKIHSIRSFTEPGVFSIILLKDKQIATCSYKDNLIRIYNPLNHYNGSEILHNHSCFSFSLCQLENGTFVSSELNNSIKIDNFLITNAHSKYISKIIVLPEHRIASCSADCTIKIWKSNLLYNDTPIKVLQGKTGYINSILYINERNVLVSCSGDKSLQLWNIYTGQCLSVITGVDCYTAESLFQIENDKVIVGV